MLLMKVMSVLILLDLSAASDTVDHNILLTLLRVSYGIRDAALDWLHSYLTGRMECIRHGTNQSMPTTVWNGVPQGSVLGPLLFILYTARLIDFVESHGLCPHLYADDTQVQGSCRAESVVQLQSTLSTFLDEVSDWMQSNRLQLNTPKTEILWCTTNIANTVYLQLQFVSEQITCCLVNQSATWKFPSTATLQCDLT